MLLDETTTVDVEEAFEDVQVGVFPIGSTEQHGPALPLSTDSRAAHLVAGSLASDRNAVVAPTISVTVSPHHRQFYGTLWVSEGTMKRYLYEILTNFTSHGVEKMIIVNGHGGNINAINEVAQQLYRDGIAFAVPWNWWEGTEEVAKEVLNDDVEVPGHAADFEASLMMYAEEELVRDDRFNSVERGSYDGSRFDHQRVLGYDFVDWTENGINGELNHASPDAGKALYEASCETLNDLVQWLARLPADECAPLSHR